jgi:hypothetical protein
MRKTAIGLGLLLLAIGSITWWALESGDVAIIETRRSDGSVRETRVWWFEASGQLWLEAGSPSNGWFEDVSANPHIVIRRDGPPEEYVAVIVPEITHHAWVRSAIRERYGFRDWWINRLIDTSQSAAVRLLEAEKLVSHE